MIVVEEQAMTILPVNARNEMYSVARYKFDFDENEVSQIDKWLKKHEKVCPLKETIEKTTIGETGKHYKFYPTGIGMFKEVECHCGSRLLVDSNF